MMTRFETLTMKIFLFGVLISMFAASKAEENMLIQQHAPNVKEGQSFKMTCKLIVNSINVLLSHNLNWKHDTELLALRDVVVHKYRDQYKVNLKSEEKPKLAMISELEILKVGPSNDGKYTCEEQKKIGDNYQTVKTVDTEIVVLQDVGELVLTIGTTQITAENADKKLNIPEKGQKFACRTKGSNPKPIMRFFLDGKDMKNDWNPQEIYSYVRVKSGAKAGVRSHSSELVAEGEYLIKKSEKVRKISCTAEVEGSPFKIKTISANVAVAFDPKFSCVNKSAILNDRYVTLECDIVANPPIKKHLWRYGDIRGVNSDNESVEYSQTYTVDKGVHKITLTIDKVTRRHFNTTFILEVITEDDKVHSHPVKLTERFLSSGSGRHYQEIFLAVLLTVSALILSI